jgi:methylmalonyl-CoA carboxyltransferase small subunit
VKYKLTIDGKTYEVDLEPIESEARRPEHLPLPGAAPRAAASSAAGFPPAGAPSGGAPVDEGKVCRSPIAGVVVRVSAQVGQSIQANDVLMVLEAMKMETTITSPVAGKVAKVNVGVGDPVQGGQVLVEFD